MKESITTTSKMMKRTATARTKKVLVKPKLHKRKHRPISIVIEDKMYTAIARYLKYHGWNVIVIGGGSRVEQPFGNAKFNYQFSVNFTGRRKQNAD